LHSGDFGGVIHNPLQALCEIIGSLHDPRSRITVPGFYDRVKRWGDSERDLMAKVGPPDDAILTDARTTKSWGEPGYTLYERTTIRPALTLNGIIGGYQGPGAKAVIPAYAYAKMNIRLVPDQDPHEIERLMRKHLASLTPPSVNSIIRTGSSARPALLDRSHPAMDAAAMAYIKGFGHRPVFLRSGGSIPAVSAFQQMLGIPTVLMGFALPDDRIHAPNEKFHLPNFFNGIATCIWFLKDLAAMRS
jgi:acetylornithine deacetylase/succinyl-diaminopimelate desuccinylase-like protein